MEYAGETDIVANVSVYNVSMNNAQNGARIKVFGGNPSPSEHNWIAYEFSVLTTVRTCSQH